MLHFYGDIYDASFHLTEVHLMLKKQKQNQKTLTALIQLHRKVKNI